MVDVGREGVLGLGEERMMLVLFGDGLTPAELIVGSDTHALIIGKDEAYLFIESDFAV